ncbi:uncharacterized protein [Macrobrachium rosenbergii]|uniref:uncharacterized protein n=1 Tax=Macrobrachium rosenbergii TaxID=79674 RepID=UPI0034D5B1F1
MHLNQAVSSGGRYLLLFLFTSPLMVSSTADSDWIYADVNITNPVKVFDLYPEDKVNSSDIIKLFFNESSVLLPCTICFWMCPAYFNTTSVPFTLVSPSLVFYLGLIEGKIKVGINDTCHILSKNLDAHKWHHLCTVIGNKSFSLYVNNETHEVDFASMNSCRRLPYRMDSVFVQLGYEEPYSFTGKISNMQVFPRQLTGLDIKDMSQCKGDRGGSSLNFTEEPLGENSAETDLRQMCKQPPREFLALFDGLNRQAEASSFCGILGGRLVNQRDDYRLLTHEITYNKDVKDELFMFWTNDSIDDVDGYVISAQRSKHLQALKYTKTSTLPVIGCMVGFGEPIMLKSDDVEELYSFPFKGRLVFQSKNGLIIYKDKCPKKEEEICLIAKAKSILFLSSELGMNKQPVGRRTWVCPYSGRNCTKTLTYCNKEQFTCNDGQCIDLYEKCDGQPNCQDESDEGDICYLTKKSSSYLPDMCPENNPEVDVQVRIDSVQEIAMVNNALSVILSVNTTWKDSRITFMNLNETAELSPEEANCLWYPAVNFVNARYEDNLVMRSNKDFVLQYNVQIVGIGQEKVRDGFEVREYNGSSVNIIRSVQYLFTFIVITITLIIHLILKSVV